jgi:hypothetical protein
MSISKKCEKMQDQQCPGLNAVQVGVWYNYTSHDVRIKHRGTAVRDTSSSGKSSTGVAMHGRGGSTSGNSALNMLVVVDEAVFDGVQNDLPLLASSASLEGTL